MSSAAALAFTSASAATPRGHVVVLRNVVIDGMYGYGVLTVPIDYTYGYVHLDNLVLTNSTVQYAVYVAVAGGWTGAHVVDLNGLLLLWRLEQSCGTRLEDFVVASSRPSGFTAGASTVLSLSVAVPVGAC